jgi:hypothetical protein
MDLIRITDTAGDSGTIVCRRQDAAEAVTGWYPDPPEEIREAIARLDADTLGVQVEPVDLAELDPVSFAGVMMLAGQAGRDDIDGIPVRWSWQADRIRATVGDTTSHYWAWSDVWPVIREAIVDRALHQVDRASQARRRAEHALQVAIAEQRSAMAAADTLGVSRYRMAQVSGYSQPTVARILDQE